MPQLRLKQKSLLNLLSSFRGIRKQYLPSLAFPNENTGTRQSNKRANRVTFITARDDGIRSKKDVNGINQCYDCGLWTLQQSYSLQEVWLCRIKFNTAVYLIPSIERKRWKQDKVPRFLYRKFFQSKQHSSAGEYCRKAFIWAGTIVFHQKTSLYGRRYLRGRKRKSEGGLPTSFLLAPPPPRRLHLPHMLSKDTTILWLPYDMTAMKSFKIYHTIVTYTLSPLHDLCLTKIALQIKWPLFFFLSFNCFSCTHAKKSYLWWDERNRPLG